MIESVDIKEIFDKLRNREINIDECEEIILSMFNCSNNEYEDRELKLIEKADENTSISWWNENRKKINSIIDMFNDWQTVYRFNSFRKKIVLARIDSLRKENEESKYEFSDWQLNLLTEMEEFLNNN